MSEEVFTGFTASFRPGGKEYDSPLVVVRGNTIEDLLVKLDADPEVDDLGTAVGRFHAKLSRQFDDAAGVVTTVHAHPGAIPAPTETKPIWASAAPSGGALVANADGTYPPCPHGTRPRKPWTSPKNGKRYLFCTLDRGAPGACPSVTV